MTKTIRFLILMALVSSLGSAAGFAQASGEETYKGKCQMCHGTTGLADTPMGKVTKTRPVTDPDVKKLTAAEQFDFTKNGKDKMKPFKDKLTDDEIKAAVAHLRTLMK